VTIDVGTNTQSILDDPFYIGVRSPRPKVGDEAYDALITEFFDAAQEVYGPQVLIQVHICAS
jgi:malate dehydrogenase (oxaloacetate-decarboxylating)(NADP+)